MKLLLLLILFNNLSVSQVGWDLDYESANFAFLKLDYNTYNLEGGYFTKFPYHKGYDNEYIPFTVIYNPPIDYGNISFIYSATADTIFAADIWWAGHGQITFPNLIDSASEFTYDSTLVDTPISTSYINYVDEIVDSVFHQKADSAWMSVKKLSILKDFAAQGSTFRVALYLYAPAVGMFQPEVAKWIIFLYRGQLITDVENESELANNYQLFQNYPNPFNPETNIEFVIAKSQNVKIFVYDILGVEKDVLLNSYQKVGRHRIIFNGSKYLSGVYFYKISTSNYSQTKKLLLLK